MNTGRVLSSIIGTGRIAVSVGQSILLILLGIWSW